MDTVGIRELEANPSRHLTRVRSGVRLVVTERGRAIASIQPIDAPSGVDWAHALVAAGRVQWSGGKPEGAARRRRGRALRARAFAAAKRKFEEDWPKHVAVHTTDALCRDAGDLAERYALRGDDSVHLAAFLDVARHAGAAATEFSSFDDRLNAPHD